jgi:hypothetical protein
MNLARLPGAPQRISDRKKKMRTMSPGPSRQTAQAPADRQSRAREAARLFDQLQQDRGTPALTFMRIRIVRPFGRLHIPQHRIAQSLQFRVFNSIEFDPKLENRDGHQLRGVPVAAED